MGIVKRPHQLHDFNRCQFKIISFFLCSLCIHFCTYYFLQEAVRKKHNLKPLVIPKKLQKNLPFDYKPKVRSGKHVDPVLSKRVAVVRDTHERKRDQLLNQMRMISTAQEMKNREGQQKRHQAYRLVSVNYVVWLQLYKCNPMI